MSLTFVVVAMIAGSIAGVRFFARHRAFKQTCAKLVDASEWHEHSIVTSTTGLWRGARVWLRLDRRNDVLIRAALPRWPGAVAVVRRFQGDEIGDPEFDETLRVFGDESAWRAALDCETRARLVAIFAMPKAGSSRASLGFAFGTRSTSRLRSIAAPSSRARSRNPPSTRSSACSATWHAKRSPQCVRATTAGSSRATGTC